MEQTRIYLLYETDEWNSTESRVLMGVFTTTETLEEAVKDLIADRCHYDIGRNYRHEEDRCVNDTVNRVSKEFFAGGMQTFGYETNLCAIDVIPNKVYEI